MNSYDDDLVVMCGKQDEHDIVLDDDIDYQDDENYQNAWGINYGNEIKPSN